MLLEDQQYSGMYLYRRIVQAKLYIDSHFAEEIELSQIADEACFSRYHFIRMFKKIVGTTPHQYLIKVRIEKAADLLRSGMPVTEVCYEVGFESPASFSALFRKLKFLSPSGYLRQQQEKRRQITSKPLEFVPGCFAHSNGWY